MDVGDTVVINNRSKLAIQPKKESGYTCVGKVVMIVQNDTGGKMAVCKEGVYSFNNTQNASNKITSMDIGRTCYFETADTVSLDNINTTVAGKIIEVCDDQVVVRIDAQNIKFTFQLNPLYESVFLFAIEDNTSFNECDLVVVNERTLLASHPRKESGYISIGRAVKTVYDENGSPLVFCKDGIYMCNNTNQSEHIITNYDIGRTCYFESPKTVSLDNINATIAGKVLECTEDKVIFSINATEKKGSWL